MIPRSPTSTTDWQRCPLYYALKREWAPRGGIWTPNKLLGTAIGDGLSALYRGNSEPEEVVRRVIGEGYVPNDEWPLESLVRLGLRGFQRAALDDVCRGAEVLMVDEPLPSRARPDLVLRVPGQGICVIDTKVSLKGGFRYVTEYTYSHQLYHYAWEVGEDLGEPVTWCKIHLINLTPLDTMLHPVEIRPAQLKLWLKGAKRTWASMASDTPTAQFSGCITKYGRCEFLDACHVIGHDPDAMEALYERIPHDLGG